MNIKIRLFGLLAGVAVLALLAVLTVLAALSAHIRADLGFASRKGRPVTHLTLDNMSDVKT